MKKTLIVNGYPRAGKTMFAKLLADEYKVLERSSIDYVKEISEEYFDWTGEKTPEYRKFLSDMKMFLSENTSIIESDLDKYYNQLTEESYDFLLIDIREPSEIKKYVERYGAKTVFIDNDKAEKETSNDSDAAVENYEYDYVLKNPNTIEGYKEVISSFVKDIEKETR